MMFELKFGIGVSRLLLLIGSFLLASCNFNAKSKSGDSQTGEAVDIRFYTVTRVVDGDTFWVDNSSEKGIKVRLIGVDAPESRNVFKKKKGYYGTESKNYLKGLLQNKRVRLEKDVDSLDRYGRTLSYVYLEDGTFLNAELVKNGYAQIMTVPPNVKFAELFLTLQREARENNRGLWGN